MSMVLGFFWDAPELLKCMQSM